MCIDKNNQLLTKLYRKPTDRQNYLHRTSHHPEKLKTNIPFSQALRLRRICSRGAEFDSSGYALKAAFVKRGYSDSEVKEQVNRAKAIIREDTLHSKEKKESFGIPFVTTFNRTLPPLAAIFRKHWSLLSLNQKLEDAFDEYPVMAFKRCRNLKDYLGSNTIENDRVKRSKHKKMNGTCKPCFDRTNDLCCKQAIKTDSFKSNTTQKATRFSISLTARAGILST